MKGSENLVANHLSWILYGREYESGISKYFPDKQLYVVHPDLWYVDIMNSLKYQVGSLRIGLKMIEKISFTM